MSITVIILIVLAVLSLGVKVHRGSLFFWSDKKDSHSEGRDDDNARR